MIYFRDYSLFFLLHGDSIFFMVVFFYIDKVGREYASSIKMQNKR